MAAGHTVTAIFSVVEGSEFKITDDTFTDNNMDVTIRSSSLKFISVKNERIRKLDISGCAKLEKLVCSGNKIRELTINDQLLSLYCDNNKLTALVLNENLIEVYCGYNMITGLELNRSLRVLHCENNQLTEITLNKRLEIFICDYNILSAVEVNEKLQFLSCAHNRISKLKLNRHISTVYCTNNNLTSLIVNEIIYNQLEMYKFPPFISIPKDIPIFKFPDRIPNDFKCPICLDVHAEDVIVTDCNHAFHVNCVILIRSVNCPYCRRPIQQLK